jgi:hypothetical protein
MALQGESTLTDAEKVTEMRRHLNYLVDFLEQMSYPERDFVQKMIGLLEQYEDRTRISNKQLFWLRDLSLKY